MSVTALLLLALPALYGCGGKHGGTLSLDNVADVPLSGDQPQPPQARWRPDPRDVRAAGWTASYRRRDSSPARQYAGSITRVGATYELKDADATGWRSAQRRGGGATLLGDVQVREPAGGRRANQLRLTQGHGSRSDIHYGPCHVAWSNYVPA
jgi:hypothetical protein